MQVSGDVHERARQINRGAGELSFVASLTRNDLQHSENLFLTRWSLCAPQNSMLISARHSVEEVEASVRF
jgi:hypothetical protein